MTCPNEDDFSLAADGELTSNALAALRAHALNCATCGMRLQAASSLRQIVAGAYPTRPDSALPDRVMAQVSAGDRRRAGAFRGPARIALVVGPALAAGIALAWLAIGPPERLLPTGADGRGLPGGSFAPRGGSASDANSVLGQRELGFEVSASGARLAAGARVDPRGGFTFRMFNRSGREVDFALFGVDAAGEVHWFFPAWLDPRATPRTLALAATPAVVDLTEAVAPEGVAPGPFTVAALFTDRPIDVRAIEVAISRGGTDALSELGVVRTLQVEVTP